LIKRFLFFVFLVFLGHIALGQTHYVAARLGATYYQGDLTPLPLNISFGPGNLATGVSYGFKLHKYANLKASYTFGRLSGDDKFAIAPERKLRNLSFFSDIHDGAAQIEFPINSVMPSLDKYKLRLYLNAGLGVVFFNPKTIYLGAEIELQPIGTEGQFLLQSDKKPYALHSLTRPLGFSVEFNLSTKMSLGMEINHIKTFTDYLDDVSTEYPDSVELSEAGQTIAVALTNRMGEVTGTPINAPGTSRGNPKKKDAYSYFGLYLKYNFGTKMVTTTAVQ
jgi:hypothetical protein